MTYEDTLEIADAVFDEYLPKVGPRSRKQFLDALFAELTHVGVMDMETGPEAADEDESYDDDV